MPKFSASFKQRVIAPAKYFAIDNGLRRANAPQLQPDLGHRLENAVALHLRRGLRELHYASERDLWECDFIIPDAAIQVCLEFTRPIADVSCGGSSRARACAANAARWW